MKNKFEATYGKTMQGIMFAVNPLKKAMLKTHCTVHKYINIRAIEILSNEDMKEEYSFYKKHVKALNSGVTWADQDFKSSNHFYHYQKGRGLYGFSDALTECMKYYNKAEALVNNNDIEKALFYFGAACHLVQDVTVPHHVNNRLLKSHRKFELWIIARLMSDYSFDAEDGIISFETLEEYIKANAYMANATYSKYSRILNYEERYSKIAKEILVQAQRSTAGFMLNFFNSIQHKIEK